LHSDFQREFFDQKEDWEDGNPRCVTNSSLVRKDLSTAKRDRVASEGLGGRSTIEIALCGGLKTHIARGHGI
jgi:hypothetical protein